MHSRTDAITSASQARASITNAGDFLKDYSGENGWRIEQAINELYTHRGTGNAFDKAIENLGNGNFVAGFDVLVPKRAEYDRVRTVAHVASFALQDLAEIKFNDPAARQLVKTQIPGARLGTEQGRGDHFHVIVRPPVRLDPSLAVRGLGQAFEGLGSIVDKGIKDGEFDNTNAVPAAAPGPDAVVSAIPFLDKSLDQLIDVKSIFDDLAERLVPPIVVNAPSAATLAANATTSFFVSFDGGLVTQVVVSAESAGGDAIATRVAKALRATEVCQTANGTIVGNDPDQCSDGTNPNIEKTNLGQYLEVSQVGGQLALTAKPGLARAFTLTTISLAGAKPSDFGQLPDAASFIIDVERTTRTETETAIKSEIVTQPRQLFIGKKPPGPGDDAFPFTQDNTGITDLVKDLNAALKLAGEQGIVAFAHVCDADPKDDCIVLAAADANITKITVREATTGASSLTGLGFQSGSTVDEKFTTSKSAGTDEVVVTTPPTSPLGFVGSDAVPDLAGNLIDTLGNTLTSALQDISKNQLTSNFNANPFYDETNDAILFDVALKKVFDPQ